MQCKVVAALYTVYKILQIYILYVYGSNLCILVTWCYSANYFLFFNGGLLVSIPVKEKTMLMEVQFKFIFK